MVPHTYVMRDLNGNKIDGIMQFNVALRRSRSRSLLEFGIFFGALFAYLCVLAFSA
jgi:hypothetical protein